MSTVNKLADSDTSDILKFSDFGGSSRSCGGDVGMIEASEFRVTIIEYFKKLKEITFATIPKLLVEEKREASTSDVFSAPWLKRQL